MKQKQLFTIPATSPSTMVPRGIEFLGKAWAAILSKTWYPFYFGACAFPYHLSWRIVGRPILRNTFGGQIEIGHRLTLRSISLGNSIGTSQPVILSLWRQGARLKIGDDVGLSGCSITVLGAVTIGDRVMIGSGALILDSDLHPLDPHERSTYSENIQVKPVVIGNDVFIGARAIILKGATIGDRSVIGAGAVVTRAVPANAIAAGNPARIVGFLKK